LLEPELVSTSISSDLSLWLLSLAFIVAGVSFFIRNIKVKTLAVILALGIFTYFVLLNFERLENQKYRETQHLALFKHMADLRSKLEFQILADIKLSEVIALFIQAQDYQFTSDQFNSISQKVIDYSDHISHMASAKDLVINDVYPFEPNKGAIGLNYRTNQQQWPAVKRAIDSREVVFDGPINLVQGGQAFLARVPVFYDEDKDFKPWGILTVVIRMNELYKSAGLYDIEELKLAIRTLSSGNYAIGQTFFGDEALFAPEQQALTQTILLPNARWELAAIPTSGWQDVSPNQPMIRLIFVLVFILLTAFILLRSKQQLEQQRINQILQNETRQRKRSESRYRELFENSNNGICLINDNKIIDCNFQFENMVGSTKKLIIDKPWYGSFNQPQSKESAEAFYKRTMDKLAHNKSFTIDWEHPKADKKCILEVTFTRLEQNERHTILVTCLDITQRKQLENEQEHLNKQLQHAHKMEAIGQLTGGIAHDFNNILSAINGYSQLAKSVVDEQDPESNLSRYLDEVLKGGDRAKELVQQMLAFGRGSETNVKPVSPQKVINETLKLLQATIPSSIDITTDFIDESTKIASDPIQLQQVIINLILNARDSIVDQKGQIKITVQTVNLDTGQCDSCHEQFEGQFLEISIQDSGIGINKDILNKVFQPFFSTKEVGKGSGMGLSVVHGIIHSSNGHISIDSEPYLGTCIRLRFPIDVLKAQDIASKSIDYERIAKRTGQVLIVDDEHAITTMLEDNLSQSGFKVRSFNDSQDAYEFFVKQAKEVALIITDQTMPKLTGVELTLKVRRINPDVPIVMCTGFSDVIDSEKAKQIGIQVFLEKPLDLPLLNKIIGDFVVTD
jgi:PAS domain S-box-containing protein